MPLHAILHDFFFTSFDWFCLLAPLIYFTVFEVPEFLNGPIFYNYYY